ncbi:MAG: DMT family transporter [Micrococcaceae bacterium]|nr:DMT family transporter [Micrococcaceae bacterium]MDN5824112.1 DMT family transporter [Micrococcaceae bacterium]MDN6178310.1 DMT family transporter [Micrococcaceae bacterium]
MNPVIAPRAKARHLPLWAGLVLAIIGGLMMPIQGRINGGLAERMGDPNAAAAISFAGGTVVMMLASVLLPRGRAGLVAMRRAVAGREFPRWYLLAGISGGYIVFGQSHAVPLIGVALFTVAIVTGQTMSGLMVDRVGFGPGGKRFITARRMAGAVLMIIAVLWAVSPRLESSADGLSWLVPVLLPFTAGLFMGFQQAMNGTQTAAYGTPITATLVNFLVGGTALFILWGLSSLGGEHQLSFPAEWWLYTGGVFGCVFIAIGALLVKSLGVLISGLCMIAGQLVGSLAIDLILPAPGTVIAVATLLGTLLTLAAVVLASVPAGRLARPTRGRR